MARSSLDYDTWLQEGSGGPNESSAPPCQCGAPFEDHDGDDVPYSMVSNNCDGYSPMEHERRDEVDDD